jgi:hypothetical protein
MIIIQNFITLCKYLINNTIGFMSIYSIEFEYIQDNEDNEELCNCNLCYTFRNIMLFTNRRLKCKKV